MVCTSCDSKLLYVDGRTKLATSPPFDVFYRRPGQAMNLASHDQLFSDNFGGSAYPTKRDTPELETKPGGPPRKRVPVAVSYKTL